MVLTFWNHKKKNIRKSIIKVLEKYKDFGEMDSDGMKMNDVMFFQKYFEILKNGQK